jgi:GDP-mannose 6-dehydrogenase
MKLVSSDTKLNISPAYLRPGFAFGGSCLPKDLRFVTHNARRLRVEVPIWDAILPSNNAQTTAARIKLQDLGAKKVGVLGLSFKSGTDDLRESPIISLIRNLWQDGVDVLVHDPDVNPQEMLGSNLDYLERQLPQIGKILCPDLQELINQSEVIVVSQKRPEYLDILKQACHPLVVLDLVRLGDELESHKFVKYRGMSW